MSLELIKFTGVLISCLICLCVCVAELMTNSVLIFSCILYMMFIGITIFYSQHCHFKQWSVQKVANYLMLVWDLGLCARNRFVICNCLEVKYSQMTGKKKEVRLTSHIQSHCNRQKKKKQTLLIIKMKDTQKLILWFTTSR